jgi:hypothetical protein
VQCGRLRRALLPRRGQPKGPTGASRAGKNADHVDAPPDLPVESFRGGPLPRKAPSSNETRTSFYSLSRQSSCGSSHDAHEASAGWRRPGLRRSLLRSVRRCPGPGGGRLGELFPDRRTDTAHSRDGLSWRTCHKLGGRWPHVLVACCRGTAATGFAPERCNSPSRTVCTLSTVPLRS